MNSSGACSQCGSLDWKQARWISGRTVCAKCAPPPRQKRESPDTFLEQALALLPAQPSGRHLAREEAERIYPGMVSTWYGEPWPKRQEGDAGQV